MNNFLESILVDTTSNDHSGLDILLTNAWPLSITQNSVTAPPLMEYISNIAAPLDDVVKLTRPRYHFTAGGSPSKFWEREPFAWTEQAQLQRATRFISLGSFGEEVLGGAKKPRVSITIAHLYC